MRPKITLRHWMGIVVVVAFLAALVRLLYPFRGLIWALVNASFGCALMLVLILPIPAAFVVVMAALISYPDRNLGKPGPSEGQSSL